MHLLHRVNALILDKALEKGLEVGAFLSKCSDGTKPSRTIRGKLCRRHHWSFKNCACCVSLKGYVIFFSQHLYGGTVLLFGGVAMVLSVLCR